MIQRRWLSTASTAHGIALRRKYSAHIRSVSRGTRSASNMMLIMCPSGGGPSTPIPSRSRTALRPPSAAMA
jgi:hypothetical protein